ncbi:putative ammonia monooxygenase [Alkaliphilus metalliredigens QYMF]|uniref:Putative ammonia monooxygenase n=1 Tax=Alkaliphilus metalliredigens (strain QYMF) TaxID=293826 RepID=A6TSB9_ALKMQ|nr:AbrB family transcriptional regulator [Alkaliphilus metalliredigens]ABR49087.1 putative ammonia monooxygenase [Alkaliphilus metalliredigens QYMF]
MIYLLIVSIGLFGWLVMRKIKAPAPALLGPMIFVGIASIGGFNFPHLPQVSVSIFQLIIGIFVGMRITRGQFQLLKRRTVLYSFILILIWTVGSSLVAANVLLTLTDLDVATALLAGTPGGLTEMSVVAFAYGADVPTVALLQLLRLTFIVSFIPFLSLSIKKKNGGYTEKIKDKKDVIEEVVKRKVSVEIIGTGLIVGVLLMYLNFPAGGLIGAIIGVGGSSIILNKSAYLPKSVQLIAQIGIGISIGLRFTQETFQQFSRLIGPMIILPLFMVLSGVLLAIIIKNITKWDLSTCLLCSAPAGLSQMIIVAEEIESDVFLVSLFQTTRLLAIYLILPQIFNWYLR